MKYLSIDAGGTFIKYAWLDEKANILSQGKKTTPRTTKEDFLAVIKEIWSHESDEKGGICLSLPGTINTKTGFVHQGGSLTYHHQLNIKKYYEHELHTQVEVENDARCAALAEMTSGHMQGIQNGIVLTFGTGVGGCFIINGDIYKGTHLLSGEVSMLICKDLKTYGHDAVLGNIAGIPGFVKRVCDIKGIEPSDGKTVFEWIEQGDQKAVEMFEKYCYDVVIQLMNLQLIIDPQRVCLGGGVSENPIFVSGIQRAMQNFYDSLPYPIPPLEIISCAHHNDANLIGAYYHFQKQHSKARS